MKIKENIDLEILSRYGWDYEEITDNYGEPINMDDILYTYNLGHSRRGQFYYYFIMKDRTIQIYASEPDGSGTWIDLDDVIIKMYISGILELEEKGNPLYIPPISYGEELGGGGDRNGKNGLNKSGLNIGEIEIKI